MKKIAPIPIKPADLTVLLAGRVPVHKHNLVLIEKNKFNAGYVLILKQKGNRVVEKIYLDENKTKVYKLEIFDQKGRLQYRSIFNKSQKIKSYQVPLQLTISNNNAVIRIDVDHYWADIPVSSSVFVLAPPG